MSYDMRVCVKVEGCDKYAVVGVPEHDNPTYNLREMFVACMDWHYRQHEHYQASYALEKIEHGISELSEHPERYERFNPANGWGSIDSALVALRSAYVCIHECAEEYPIECLFFRW